MIPLTFLCIVVSQSSPSPEQIEGLIRKKRDGIQSVELTISAQHFRQEAGVVSTTESLWIDGKKKRFDYLGPLSEGGESCRMVIAVNGEKEGYFFRMIDEMKDAPPSGEFIPVTPEASQNGRLPHLDPKYLGLIPDSVLNWVNYSSCDMIFRVPNRKNDVLAEDRINNRKSYRISFEAPNLRVTYWVDKDHLHRLLRLEVEAQDIIRTQVENRFEDEKLADYGIPSHFMYSALMKKSKVETKTEATVRCTSINQRVADTQFHLNGLQLRKGTIVSGLNKGGHKVWNGEKLILEREWKMREQIQQEEGKEKSNKKQQYYLIALISTGVALAICVYLFWFRRRSHKTSPEALSTHPAT